ncbi:hypothetical protein LEP1GSC058_3637 [Leptospira fainei serovar Hurstbridge str. BUT 6]|uniref:P83/100 protein n=1 Tax=Leptospira fainei serovar Hurstbridge str. BUT 6 TaxID=1193011 RepID=S3UVM1_9LEPT|nr:P83/100 family protein [Leptospira fainei]EPG73308.1 hypothetical protein LEP1GSC058_3637 [Leptospira fainei serovar Hurstbridge str. BUT 6]
MSRIRLTVLAIVLGSFATSLHAQSGPRLGETEVRSSGRVNFINRSAAKADEDTKGSNAKMGAALAESLKKDATNKASEEGVSAIRILPEDKKFGADIISLGKETEFGHINSIQRILTGYVKANFGYSEQNSETLATYILYYNAIHRKGTPYVKRKYGEEVVKNLTPDKIGIARRYSEWPDKTQIVIPIVGNILSEDGKDVHTDELETEVNKDLNKKKEGQDDKKKMDDLQRNKIEEEKRKLEEKKDENKKQQQQAAEKERKVEKELQELNKDPVKNKKQIVQKQEEKKQVQQQQQQAKKEEQQLKEKEKEIAKKEETRKSDSKSSSSDSAKSDSKKDSSVASNDSKKDEAKPDEKKSKEELQKELKDTKKELETVKEEQKKKEEFDKNVVGGKILFLKTLKYLSDGHYSNELHVLDPANDDEISKGEFNKICGRTFEVVDGKALVVGYESDHSAEHKLILIDQDTLKPAIWSKDSVFWRSPMILKGEEVYAFEERNGKYFLARFDKSLKKLAGSEEEISPNSNVTFFGDKIYVTGKEEGAGATQITVFNKADLKLIKMIKP